MNNIRDISLSYLEQLKSQQYVYIYVLSLWYFLPCILSLSRSLDLSCTVLVRRRGLPHSLRIRGVGLGAEYGLPCWFDFNYRDTMKCCNVWCAQLFDQKAIQFFQHAAVSNEWECPNPTWSTNRSGHGSEKIEPGDCKAVDIRCPQRCFATILWKWCCFNFQLWWWAIRILILKTGPPRSSSW